MKKLLIILLIIILVPIGVLVALYFTVDSFHEMANNVLAKAPGFIGENFRSIPNDEDLQKDIEEISDYLLNAETDLAVDKLLITESNDEKIYQQLIKQMNRLDPNKTAKLLEEIRKNKLKESPIEATLEKIREEKEHEASLKADYISTLNLSSQMNEIKEILDENVDSYKKIVKVLELLPEQRVIEILSLLEKSDRDGIIKELDEETSQNYKKKIYERDQRMVDLKNIAKILEAKPAVELVEPLGLSSSYAPDEVICIFIEMGPKKTAEVLSKINNEVYTEEVMKNIRDRKILVDGVDTFTENLIEALNIYREYDDKMNELVSIYREVEEEEVAKTIRTLYWNTGVSKTYSLKNGEEIVISDEDLALDLLRSFPSKKIAGILSHLDNRIASDIFTKLALPKPE